MPEIIAHKAAVILRLIDTTNGMGIDDNVRFFIDGVEKKPMPKPDGHFVFFQTDEKIFEIEVRVFGFEPMKYSVNVDDFAGKLPLLKLELVPNLYYQTTRPCHTLSGKLPGITQIDAVKLGENSCLIREFDARKRILTVFNPHQLALDRVKYALVNPDELNYESFIIVERLSDKTFKIDRQIKEGFASHFPISSVVRGITGEDGNYLLRVRDISTDSRWLVRYRAAGEEFFKPVDFTKPDTVTLDIPTVTTESGKGSNQDTK